MRLLSTSIFSGQFVNRDVHTNEDRDRTRRFLFGSTGGTGRLIVRDALAKGRSVVVLVRSNARALDLPSLSALEGAEMAFRA